MQGVEDVQIVVDTGAVVERAVPRAFQDFAKHQDMHVTPQGQHNTDR